MTLLRNTDRLRYHAPVLVCLLLVLLLVLLPTGFEDAVIYKGADRCAAQVLSVDNSSIIDTGLIRSGEQTCTLELLGGRFEGIHGAVMPNSESLLYSGYQDLNLTRIFMASIFIGSSGAVMDLSVDITSAVKEVVDKKPGMGWREAARSGMNVGRAAMGTMTTTLLLAYSGGYVALLMVFMAQGTPVWNILNYKYVASEIIDTIVGSFGLVTVAPFTAVTSGYLLTRGKSPL